MQPNELLELALFSTDLDKTVSLREYLKELLSKVWEEGEGFSGKRPFGDSGWERQLEIDMIESGLRPYRKDKYDELEYDGDFYSLISDAINAL